MPVHAFILTPARPHIGLGERWAGIRKPFTFDGITVHSLTEYTKDLHDFVSEEAAINYLKTRDDATTFAVVSFAGDMKYRSVADLSRHILTVGRK